MFTAKSVNSWSGSISLPALPPWNAILVHPVAQPEGSAPSVLRADCWERLESPAAAASTEGSGFWDVEVMLVAQPVAQLVAMVLLMEALVEHVELLLVQRTHVAVFLVLWEIG